MSEQTADNKSDHLITDHALTLPTFTKALLLVIWFSTPVLFERPVMVASPSSKRPGTTMTSLRGAARYRIDASQSRFTVRAFAGGLFSALAHDHTIAIREFDGETDFTYGTVEPASLQMTIKAASLAVTDKISEKDRQKIESTMRDEVLEVSQFPEITFKSSDVNATKTGEGQYQVRIQGEIKLHGAARPLTINAQLGFGDKVLHAKGAFSLKQSNFGIKPVSVAGGTIKVKDELKFTFDIVAHP